MSGFAKSAIAAAVAGSAAGGGDRYWASTVLLLNGEGASDGGQNNTFLDSSTNNHTLTRAGNPTQGSFSPFSVDDGKWCIYFDNVDGLSFDSASSQPTGTQNFTIECWFKFVSSAQQSTPIIENYTATDNINRGVGLYFSDSTNTNGNGIRFSWSLDGTPGANSLQYDVTWDKSKWYHVAVVRNGTDITMYLDGVSVDTYNIGTESIYDSSRTFKVSDSQISTFYNSIYLTNLRIVWDPVYTAAFTPPTSPLTAITNTKLLIAQSNRFIDNSTSAETITIDATPHILPESPFTDTTEYDASTNSGSGYFDGAVDRLVSAQQNQSFAMGSGDFTIECWVYTPSASPSNYAGIISLYNGGAPTGVILEFNSSQWGFYNGSAHSLNLGAVILNSWNHAALVRESGTLKLYVNGVLIGSAATATNFSTNTGVRIGALDDNNSYPYTGYISDARIVKGTAVYTSNFTPPTAPLTSVSGTSILCKFTNASIFDATGKNVLETVGNAQVDTTTVKYGTGAMEFDETGDYLQIPPTKTVAFNQGDFTIELWVYFATSPGDGEGLFQLSSGYLNTQVRGPAAGATSGTGNWAIYHGTTQTNASFGPSQNTWYHVAYVRNSGVSKLYIDGTEAISQSDTTNYTDEYFIIGGWYNTSYLLNGYIDNFRITKGIARYTANFTPPTKELPIVGG